MRIWSIVIIFLNLLLVSLGFIGWNIELKIPFFLYFSFLLLSGILINILLIFFRVLYVLLLNFKTQLGGSSSETIKGINYIAGKL